MGCESGPSSAYRAAWSVQDVTDLQEKLEILALNAFQNACHLDRLIRHANRIRRHEQADEIRYRLNQRWAYIHGLEKLMEWDG